MKPILLNAGGAIALTFAIAACIPASAPEPAPPPQPRPVQTATPAPTPTPAPRPASSNWIDAPQTPGDWSYRPLGNDSQAYFGSASEPMTAFSVACDSASRTIQLGRPGRTAASMTIRTETATRTFPAGSGPIAVPPSTVATLPANDPLLDAIALTRGRFAVETPGMPTLYLPNWAEVIRVIEDCR